jgi:indole-3-glycerol phosphate synthase
MNILDTIIAYKREEVEKNKINHPVTSLRASNFYQRNTLSLQSLLTDPDKTGIIAEFKRRSPSKGVIHPNPDILSITKDYMEGGASGLSILTDQHFFGGSNQDLINARMHNIPILRKEFIIDTYQIEEAKSIANNSSSPEESTMTTDASRHSDAPAEQKKDSTHS